jgi:hypothetical protein
VLRVVEVGMGIIKHDADGRGVVPIGDHQVIVVAAADAGAVEQQITAKGAAAFTCELGPRLQRDRPAWALPLLYATLSGLRSDLPQGSPCKSGSI